MRWKEGRTESRCSWVLGPSQALEGTARIKWSCFREELDDELMKGRLKPNNLVNLIAEKKAETYALRRSVRSSNLTVRVQFCKIEHCMSSISSAYVSHLEMFLSADVIIPVATEEKLRRWRVSWIAQMTVTEGSDEKSMRVWRLAVAVSRVTTSEKVFRNRASINCFGLIWNRPPEK
ncbi:hypothetical protein CVT26_007748 [Gymnopilus dilepis]|uniref:Uncharacterized protein n=1 Tax=Gymnopilus dilepis TaxID=231916 RepID=A0A409X689_9AGAR|nr:hypothetical protein CVT26_007748 [Gymnopilus dilepis]